MPAHQGFEQLAIVLERDGKYREAMLLCSMAMDDGWFGDWANRIERCQKKSNSWPDIDDSSPA